MRRIVLLSSALSCLALTLLAGCVGDDTDNPLPDSGTSAPSDGGHDATMTTPIDSGAPDGDAASTPVNVDGDVDASNPLDAATDAAADAPGDAAVDALADAAVTPKYLTLSYEFDDYSETECAAFDLAAGHAAGHLQYASYGVNMSTARSPWVLEQANDVVLKLDPTHPWIPTASWSIASPTPEAGGYPNANAYSVAETATHAYVAVYNRNSVPVLDTTTSPDGGAPVSTIDLSSFLQPGDPDDSVEDSAALYDSTTGYVWLVLQNINEEAPYGGAPDYTSVCTPGLTGTVVAIDTATNALVPELTYTLGGINPTSAVLDTANHRLILLDVGCTAVDDAGADAGPGPVTGRIVESIDLTTGKSSVLLDANAMHRPGGMAFANEHLVFLSFGGATYAWDPSTPTLGAALPNTPDIFTWDGQGLIGPRTNYLDDGGVSIDVIRVDPLTGAATTLGSNPMSTPDPNGFFESVDLWPRP